MGEFHYQDVKNIQQHKATTRRTKLSIGNVFQGNYSIVSSCTPTLYLEAQSTVQNCHYSLLLWEDPSISSVLNTMDTDSKNHVQFGRSGWVGNLSNPCDKEVSTHSRIVVLPTKLFYLSSWTKFLHVLCTHWQSLSTWSEDFKDSL